MWYELTDPVLEYVKILGKEQAPQVLIEFYELFLRDLETKINYLKYAIIVASTSRRMENKTDANAFLAKIRDRLSINKEAQLLLRIEMATNMLTANLMIEAGDELLKIKDSIDKGECADTLIYSEFYKVYARYFHKRMEHEEFYQYALQFLAYSPSLSLNEEEKVEWSVNMGVAVILGKRIYNLGELIEKDILKSLTKTEFVWLYDLLHALNGGKVHDFYKALEHYKDQIEANVAIKNNLDNLIIKARIMALLDYVFTRQKEERSIPFAAIAKIADIKLEDVEWLAMKAMSLELIKGEIDEVEKIVKVTWVKPRVLDSERILIMKDTIEKWKVKVQKNLKDLEEKTGELVKP